MVSRWRLGVCVVLFVCAAPGCTPKKPPLAAAEPAAIPISLPVQREVTDFVDFTGRTDPVESVNVVARVTGYLVDIPFKEGSEIKAGDLLCEIDPRPYKAQLAQAQGQVRLYSAQARLSKTIYTRDQSIASTITGGVSKQQLEQDLAAVEEADARVKAYEAALDIYKLNLDFTKVLSPIDGMVSRYYLTKGNLVNQDQTVITTIVTLDPMYAYFDLDEPTLLKIKRAVNEGKIKLPQPKADVPVFMGLQGEDGYPHRGKITFINNQVNPTTGSISVRGEFPNHKPENGTRLLVPGMFVRIRLPIGEPHQALLVIDRAIASDQGLKYVYLVDDHSKIQYRRVTTGALQEDGLRVIVDGLKATDRVVVGGLPQIRPHMTVHTELGPMPSMDAPAPAVPPKKPG